MTLLSVLWYSHKTCCSEFKAYQNYKIYMKKLINLKDQNLNLDYLTLNIPNSVGWISEFAEIFFKYGFNSKVFYVSTNESQTILEDKKLFHTLTF